jgi:hypothetical protein
LSHQNYKNENKKGFKMLNKKEFIAVLKEMVFAGAIKKGGILSYIFCEIKDNILYLRSTDETQSIEKRFDYVYYDCSFDFSMSDISQIDKLSDNITINIINDKVCFSDDKNNILELNQCVLEDDALLAFYNQDYTIVSDTPIEIEKSIISSCDKNNPKLELNCIYFDCNENNIVSTDTRKLTIQKIDNLINYNFFLPKSFLKKSNIIDKVYQSEKYFKFEIGGDNFYLKKSFFGRYPDYKRIIPNSINDKRIKVNGLELKEILKACKGTVELQFKEDNIFINEDSILRGTIKSGAYFDKMFPLFVNKNNLFDVISNNEISLQLNKYNNIPFTIFNNNSFTVIMPVVVITSDTLKYDIIDFKYNTVKKIATKKVSKSDAKIKELEKIIEAKNKKILELESRLSFLNIEAKNKLFMQKFNKAA